MNADLQGMLDFHKNRNLGNLIVTDKGKTLNDAEARTFIKYCLSQGHTELKTCPEFEDVVEKLEL